MDKNVSQGFNHAFGLSRFILRILGAWPDPYYKSVWSTFRVAFILLTMIVVTISTQTIKMLLSLRDLNVVMEIFVNCNAPISIAAVKLFNLWYHRNVLRNLLLQVTEDWASPCRKQEMVMMWTSAKTCRYCTIGIIILNKTSLYTQMIANMLEPIAYVKSSHINDTQERPLYFMGSFPYDTNISPNYELTMCAQIISVMFASYTYSSSDSFYFCLIFHLIGQLSILELKLSELPEEEKSENYKREILRRFQLIHKEHNRLWRFYTSIENSFNKMFLIQMIPCIFVLCTQGYVLIMLTEAEYIPVMSLIFMIYFLMLFLFTILGYCYVAEALRQKSFAVGLAVYNSDWVTLEPKEARLLILIIARCQRPFELTAGKFAVFSLELYCSILKTAAGYLSMLLAVKNRMMENVKTTP